jgi:hypothetical protein
MFADKKRLGQPVVLVYFLVRIDCPKSAGAYLL